MNNPLIEVLQVEQDEKANIESSDAEKSIVHYITTPHMDRVSDIVKPKGIIDSEFNQTRTVFFNHDYNKPIGRNLWLKPTEAGVKAKTMFSENAFAQEIYQLHKEKVLNSWSIGFSIPRKKGIFSEPLPGALEYDEHTGIRKINMWVLHEYSSAGVPMNPNAIDLAKSIASSVELKSIIKQYDDVQYMSNEEIQKLRTEITNLNSELEELQCHFQAINEEIKKQSGGDNIIEELTKTIEHLEQEVKSLKDNSVRKIVENSQSKNRLRSHEVREIVLGEFSKITGRKYK